MTNPRNILASLLAIVMFLLTGASALAADKRLDALQKKFEQRYPRIVQLKKAGAIGETYDGYLDFVKSRNGDAAKVVDEENVDRKQLYKIIADNEGITPENVAERAAKKNFAKAAKGDYLKGSDGKWTQKS